MSPLALYLLGPPRVERDGKPVEVNRRKALALVAYLAVTGQSHSRDYLVNLLWPEYDSSRGRAALRRTLSLPSGMPSAATRSRSRATNSDCALSQIRPQARLFGST